MSLLNPLGLLLLLLVPPLILLYFLKLKRPRISVPSTLLWQKVIEDMRVNSPFQRLKRSLLLLLQLLALLAAIAAIARPLLRVTDRTRESLVFLLDNSASMNAREPGGRTRLELARARILRIVERLPDDSEAMLIVFNTRASIAADFSAGRHAFPAAVAATPVTECATDVAPALLLARSVAATRSHPRILLFSDGAFPAPPAIELPVPVEYEKIGTPLPNLAVTGLDIRRSLTDHGRIEAFVALENFSDSPFSGNMTLRLDNQPLDIKPLSVPPRETLSQIFEAELPLGGVLQVDCEVDDALAADNRAWKIVFPPTRRRVTLVGENRFFLERVFRAMPGMDCRSIPVAEFDADEAAGSAAIIWTGVDRPPPAAPYHIYFNAVPALDGLQAGPRLESPDIADWDTSHPINRFLDFDNLLIMSALSLKLPDSAQPLLRSSRTPLVALLDLDDGPAVVAGFDPLQSNWPLLVSFPLFMNNCLDYFEARRQRSLVHNLPTGSPILLPAALKVSALITPSGERLAPTRTSRGEWSFPAVRQAGAYRVEREDGEPLHLAVNLLSRGESALDPVEAPVLGGRSVPSTPIAQTVNREYWRHLVAAFGALLLLEWWVYHRRVFV